MIVAIQEVAESSTVRLRAEIGDERCPARAANGRSEVVEHDLATLAVEVDGAPGRQEREVGGDLVDDRAAAGVKDRLQPIFEAELATVLADQVDDREVALAGSAAQAAAKLLGEYRRRRCRPKQEDAVDVGHVDALAENLDGEHAAEPTCPQSRELPVTLMWRVVPGERDALQSGLA